MIFPKRCVGCNRLGSYICSDCLSFIDFNSYFFVCPLCNKSSIDGATHLFCKTPNSIDGTISAVLYKGIIKRLIHGFKYKPYLSDLRDTIGELFYESLIQNEVFNNLLNKNHIIVSVPLHVKRERERGYNHAALLAEYLGEKFNLEVCNKALLRIKNTAPQFRLKKEERKTNIYKSFVINEKIKNKIREQNIFLVDDIATTCFTLCECAMVLKRNGAKSVWGLTFAKEM